MADSLGDPLARAARRDALRRRVIEGTIATSASAPASTPAPAPAGNGNGGEVAPPVWQLAEAARRVLVEHPDASITITVEAAGAGSTVRLARSGDQLLTTMTGVGPAGEHPGAGGGGQHRSPEPHRREHDERELPGQMSERQLPERQLPGQMSERELRQAAARLAELLRHDPSLLSGTD